MWEHSDINLVTTGRRRNNLVLEPNYHTRKFFTEYLVAIQMKKTQILMNKPAYLGLSIQELSEILLYEFWYDYVKPNMEKKQNCVLRIQTVSLYTQKQIIFIKVLQKMLKLQSLS